MKRILEPHGAPSCLRDLPQWVCWKYIGRSGKRTKCPVNDPEKGRPKTFISLTVDHAVADIIKSRTAAIRDYRVEGPSLNTEFWDKETGETCELFEIIDETATLNHLGELVPGDQEIQELEMDIETALDRLSDEDREMCEMLRYHSKAEVARRLGMPVSTLKHRVKTQGPVFRRLGLGPEDE